MKQWTPERIADISADSVKNLRANAAKQGATWLVVLCDADLARRAPVRVTRRSTQAIKRSQDDVVLGFHFVCINEQGVTRNSDGTAWTGTWVVDRTHARRASSIGSYVALHSEKCEPSYLQGVIKDFRRRQRERSYAQGQRAQTEYGIDFLFELTDKPYEWAGDGAGEKGYAWGRPS